MLIRTQVAILGAGPAGLVLARLLEQRGIESVILELKSREYVEGRVRAGVLEQGTVDLLCDIGVGERLRRQGMVHRGIELRFRGRGHRIDLHALTEGRTITIYGQHEVVKDLVGARVASGGALLFSVDEPSIDDPTAGQPVVRCRHDGRSIEVTCDFIAGCDGFHGISRPRIATALATYERTYPFGWLGILAEVPPPSEELIYAHHDRGFALVSMRSRQISRLYLQCSPEEDLDRWPDDRIWEELALRLATADGRFALTLGPVLQKGVTGMRSFVVEPMQLGNLFLAGDAAHIVPPTGAKGLNLAVADVGYLAEALIAYYRTGSGELIDRYSETCLARVWKAQRFSWWMTNLTHRFPEASPFERRAQAAELAYLATSKAAQTVLAENYVGLPIM